MSDSLDPGVGLRQRVAFAIGGALLLVLVAVGLWLGLRQPEDVVQGMADADSVNVAAKITARLARLHAREGERVKDGQLLFELDSPEVAAKARQADAVVAAAEALAGKAVEGTRREDIVAAEANWKRADAGASLAEATFRRVDNLYREGVVTRQKRDEAQAQAISARELARAARSQLDMAHAGARRQDREAAQAQLQQAEGARAEVEAAQRETRGHAPLAGEVGKRMVDVGEIVPAGYPVFTLVDVDHPWVAVHLREDQLARVRQGGTVAGQIPALGGQKAEFEVVFISPAADYATWRSTRQSSGYDVRSFEVRLRPRQPIAGFRPGMSVLFAWPRA